MLFCVLLCSDKLSYNFKNRLFSDCFIPTLHFMQKERLNGFLRVGGISDITGGQGSSCAPQRVQSSLAVESRGEASEKHLEFNLQNNISRINNSAYFLQLSIDYGVFYYSNCLTLSCRMLKNAQTYFNNLAVWTPQDFKGMFGLFSTLCMKI